MKHALSILRARTLILGLLFLAALPARTLAQTGTKDIALEDLWMKYRFFPASPEAFNWMKDDQFYTVFEKGNIEQYSIKDQKKVKTLLETATLTGADGQPLKVQSFSFNADESKILLICDAEPVYRRSSLEICYVYSLNEKKLYSLHNAQKVSLATFSPDGSRIAYVADNDLYTYEFATSRETRITSDGKRNSIINGATDWVYEEEFAFTHAFDWSADSRKIGFIRFDESAVKEFSMDMYGSLYPEQYRFKYPKAGEANSEVQLFIYHVDKAKMVKCDIGAEKDIYLPRLKWTANASQLAVMRMNRLQNQLDVLIVDAESGSSKVILTEREEAYVNEVTDNTWHFLKNGTQFLWMSERDGYNHIYLYNFDGSLVGPVTSGAWDVADLSAVDEANNTLYYMSTEPGPTERHLYSIRMDGKKKNRLTETAGWHNITFSSAFHYYMDESSSLTSVPQAGLYDVKGKEVLSLEKNERLKGVIAEYNLGKAEFFSFKTTEDVSLNGYMIKPPSFDPNKKYPVLMYVYGGPGIQTVKNEYGGFNYFWHQMLAQKGYIVVSVDGRGTGGRGEAFRKATYKQLGKLELQDQVETAKWLQQQSYVDGSRIGIWGWSFGGYMTSLCMTKGAEYFKMGIAVAPVTTWRYYDTIYTERYLQRPQENAAGYDENSPIQFANLLKGKYLLVHGMADDNVHFQNAVDWTDALIKANKQFDMAFYPNKNHGIYGGVTRFHLYKKMTDYILENL